jgi:hypothetical protein
MTSIRATSVMALLVLVLVAACGSSAASSPSADSGAGAGSGGSPAAAGTDSGNGPAATAVPGAGADAAKVGEQLKPPNSNETSKTTTDTYWYVIYESTDSPDSLKSFYETQIPRAGMKVISTTSANGSYVWAIARDEAATFGGSVTVAPSGNGSGSSVIVGIGSN